MNFSVLIPTYNRLEKLKVVLEALFQQDEIEEGEIIVGIDGSTDGTEEYLKGLGVENLSFFKIANSGRSVIRNKLLDKAQGSIVIFIQDDIVVDEDWLSAHLDAHKKSQGARVGYMTWYPEMKISPYMKWLENGGHLLDFSGLKDGQEIDFWHFYMGNISFPKNLLEDLRLDESIDVYGWEDIMMGYEFVKRGNKVYYSASSRAFHWHEYREEDLKSYMNKVGKSAVMAEKKYPGVGFLPSRSKKTIFVLLIFLGKIFWIFLPRQWKWYLQMKKWFLEAA